MKRVCKRNNVPYFSFNAIRHLSASMKEMKMASQGRFEPPVTGVRERGLPQIGPNST